MHACMVYLTLIHAMRCDAMPTGPTTSFDHHHLRAPTENDIPAPSLHCLTGRPLRTLDTGARATAPCLGTTAPSPSERTRARYRTSIDRSTFPGRDWSASCTASCTASRRTSLRTYEYYPGRALTPVVCGMRQREPAKRKSIGACVCDRQICARH